MTTILSGIKLVTVAGTAEQIAGTNINKPLAVKALATNSGVMYLGNDGTDDVSSITGYPLSAGEGVIFGYLGDMGVLYIDSQYSGEGVAWLVLEK